MTRPHSPEHYAEIRQKYLDWLLTPPAEREPKTKAGFCEAHGVVVKTIWNWERSDEFRDKLLALRKEWGAAFHADILNRLMGIVNEGSDTASINAAKVLLNHLDIAAPDEQKLTVDSDAVKDALREAGFDVK